MLNDEKVIRLESVVQVKTEIDHKRREMTFEMLSIEGRAKESRRVILQVHCV